MLTNPMPRPEKKQMEEKQCPKFLVNELSITYGNLLSGLQTLQEL